MSRGRRSRRHADRDGLWPGGGRDVGSRYRLDLCGQEASGLQSADRACAGPGDGAQGAGVRARPGAGLDGVALRLPSHPVARALIEAAGVPLAAPSANLSGHVSPTLPKHVRADLDGRIDIIPDAGPTEAGLESTIVA